MKKKTVWLAAVFLLFCGCGRANETTNPTVSEKSEGISTTVNFLEVLETAESEEIISAEEDEPELITGSDISTMVWKDGKVQCEEDAVYSGERMTFTARCNGYLKHVDYMNCTVMLLNDGIPQPFFWDGAEEEQLFYTLQWDSRMPEEGIEFEFSFIPRNVPYGDRASIALVIGMTPGVHFSEKNVLVTAGMDGFTFNITADSPEHAVLWEEAIPEYGGVSSYVRESAETDTLGGVAVTEKLTSDTQLNTYHTAYRTSGPLYGMKSSWRFNEKEEDLVFYSFVDGVPKPLFDGSFYCQGVIWPGELYELPLDMEQIGKGEHQIWIAYIRKSMVKDFWYDPEGLSDAGKGPECVIYVYDLMIE